MPSGWTVAKLKDIADWSSGGTPKATVPEYYGGDIPWLIIGDLNDGYVYKSASSLTTLGLKESSAKMVKPYSVLVAMYGSIGKLGINRIPVATNQAIAFTEKLYEIVTNRYLFFYLLFVRPQLLGLGQGGTQKNISQTILKEVFISLPPLPEQHRIIAKIEELFSELDKGVESLKTAQEQLKIYRQSVLQRAFEGTLTEEWRKTSWQWTMLGDFAKEIKIGPFGTMLHESDYVQEGIPVINPKHIKNQRIFPDPRNAITSEKVKELSAYVLKENDIVLGRRGEMGRTASVTQREAGWLCGTGSMIIRLIPNNSAKLYSMILAERRVRNYLEENCAGTTMNNLNEKIVRQIPIPIIPVSEQPLILAEIESRLSVCDKLEESISQSLLQAEALRQSILKKAFAGLLVPQDPQDEPAEKLLARIRAERAQAQSTQKVAKGRKKQ